MPLLKLWSNETTSQVSVPFCMVRSPEGSLGSLLFQYRDLSLPASNTHNYNPSNILAREQMVETRHMTEYSPIFKTARVRKIYEGQSHNRLHCARKFTWIFVLRHYLFLKAHSWPQVTLEENCELWGTGNVHRRISEHISARNDGYICSFYARSVPEWNSLSTVILQTKKFLKCDWLRPVVFKPNLKYLHVKITASYMLL